jgi:type IV pilus assembly protein PilY1
MKAKYRRLICSLLSLAMVIPPQALVHAEDTDLFVGNPASQVQQPNVLVIIDSSDNWAAQNQNWPGEFQGQAELSAFAEVLKILPTENIGVGLMLMTAGVGNDASDPGWQNKDGAYVRFAITKMDATGKGALREMLLGTSPDATNPTAGNCVDGPNSLAATPFGATEPRNCIYKNAASGPLKEGVGSNVDYGTAMFEAFKYFGGGDGVATASRAGFGPLRYSGNPDGREDPRAFNPTTQRSVYKPPIDETNNCAKNYIIFVGNGFPNQNNSGTTLANVNAGNTTQLEMAAFSESFKTDSLGVFSDNVCRTLNQCRTLVATEFAGNTTYDSYSCQFKTGVTTTTGCSGSAAKNWEKLGIDQDVTVVNPTGSSVTPPAASVPIRYADEWAQFMATHDVNAATGVQNVQTYTIDVFKDQPDKDQTSLLFSMAKYGQGKYFQATNLAALQDAFQTIFNEILAENSVFAAASLPVSATNRAQNENQVFFGLFRPDKDALPRWYGNLKRYKVAPDPNDADLLILADRLGKNAVNASSGFFEPCAASFWTNDTSTYWQFLQLSSNCALSDANRPAASTSLYSDLPDGEQVEKGGAAHVLRAGNLSTARAMKTCENDTCSTGLVNIGTFDASGNVTATALTPDRFSLAATDTATRDKIVQYTYGRDVGLLSGDPAVVGEKVSDSDGDAATTRPSVHGDVVHSRPLPVNYGSSTGIVAYYGTNDGLLRAVKTGDATGTGGGQELWSFIAPEHHSRLKRLRNNSEPILYPGSPDASALPKDYFFDGTIGLYQNADNSEVIIFPAMRRGGRMLYAFNVTNPASPTLLWRVGCTNADLNDTASCTSSNFEQMGQTWSTPNVAFIKGFDDPANPNNTTTGADPVVVVGGGYDTCEDTDNKTTTCPNNGTAKGAKVYVMNARTGAFIKSFSTDRSVAADVALVERNFDGAVDHAYVADTGGNVYRIDFVNPADASQALAPANWQIYKIATVDSTSGKKFFFAPSVLPIKSGTQEMVILTLGTGDRERPLVVNYPVNSSKGGPVTNTFYAFIDKLETNVTLALDDPSAADEVKIYNNTDDTSDANRIPNGECLPEIRGWRKVLSAGTGEQTVTSSLVTQGRVFFNTHTATSPAAGQCNSLGDGRGYNQDLFCGGGFFVNYEQGGLPISPVQGTTTLDDGRVVTFCIGCATDEGTTNPYTPGPIKPVISPVRSRLYWYRDQDK